MSPKCSLTHRSNLSWKLEQHLAAEDGFPFLLTATDVQLCVDYPPAHRECCWTRVMLYEVWKPFSTEVHNETGRNEAVASGSQGSSWYLNVPALSDARSILSEMADSINKIYPRQKPRYSYTGVSRLRYIHALPPIIRLGRNVKGVIRIALTLQRCRGESNGSDTALFPTFLALEPVGEFLHFFAGTPSKAARSDAPSSTVVLLPLQHINDEKDTATYDTYEALLRFESLPPWLSASSGAREVCLQLNVYAAFYHSAETQARLDMSLKRLRDWKPKMYRDLRFGILDPEGEEFSETLNVSRRKKAWLMRNKKAALSLMDSCTGTENEDVGRPPAELRHVGTLRNVPTVVLETCIQSRDNTAAAVMPEGILWPLSFGVVVKGEMVRQTSPIPASASLRRLSHSLTRLEEGLGIDG
uniref:Uncharacterized protein n=1 Tax=Trypanosoma congolense (strain IL3000) TaxID=1068625 RepID=G0UUR9_TRYCI|nr:conserved hypothetical protein [Trypanosoma congolense IL3000]